MTSPLRVLKEVRPDFGKALKGPEKLPHSVPKGPLGLVQGEVFSEKIFSGKSKTRKKYYDNGSFETVVVPPSRRVILHKILQVSTYTTIFYSLHRKQR
jgi:hypothetical protein